MSEPTTSGATAAVATAVSVPAASLLPFIHTDLLIGAFGGGIIFVLHAQKFGILKRFCFMLVSMFMGYFGGSELIHREYVMNEAIAAFIVSALIVTVAIFVIEKIQDGSFLGWFQRK